MKKFLSRLFAVALVLSLIVPGKMTLAAEKTDDIKIIFTNDVHCATGSTADDASKLGYASVATFKKSIEETTDNVLLVDCGDHLQGDVYGVLSSGQWIVELMNAAGYDYATFGNHEFDYKMQGVKDAVAAAEYTYLSCNFMDLTTGESMAEAYAIEEFGDIKVAIIGISTPETFTKSTPAYFKNEDGEFIYDFREGNDGQDLYDRVQEVVDEVRDDVDYVIAIAHLGVDPTSSPWTSYEVIENTTGIDVVLDGHSHTQIPNPEFSFEDEDIQTIVRTGKVENADGEEVLLAQTGTKFTNIGLLTITADGKIAIEMVKADVDAPIEKDADVTEVLEGIEASSAEELAVVAGETEYPLYINNPDDPAERLIRKTETNAGDFVADAYRAVSGADVACVNGGGIRTDIAAGEVTVGTLRSLHPFGNALCVKRTTGQKILDLLEMSVSKMDENGEGENGGFQHVSGIKYTADLTIPSSVETNDKGEFVGIGDTRRITSCQILNADGKYVDIDPKAEYTIASHNYMLKQGGDGINMFVDDELLMDEVCLDYEVVLKYFALCGGSVPEEYSNPLGQGRATIYTATNRPAATLPQTGVATGVVFYVCGSMLLGAGAVVTRKNRKEN